MARVLIVGGRGQLGQALVQQFTRRRQDEVIAWQRPEVDLTRSQIVQQVAELRPHVVINAAAWTNVDGAEANPEAAFAANMLGPKYLAEGCERCNALLIQVSTNEVFAGDVGHFYREYEPTAPRSIYARSKSAGENAVQQHCRRWMIVRVAWLFGLGGNNFPAKIVAAADKMGALRLVSDEIGNPTYAPDVARALWQLVQMDCRGIYHLINQGYTSRLDFARLILEASGRAEVPITPIMAKEWPRPAPPPLHAVLVNQAAAALEVTLRPWQEAAEEYAQLALRKS